MTTTIRQADLIDSVAAALQYISYYHPADYIAHLARAYAREQSPAAKDAIAQILTNSKMCAEGKRPICQDTGIVNVFLKIGMDVKWEGFTGSIADAVNQGVCSAAAADAAMRLGVNYPKGPLAWADEIGIKTIRDVLVNLGLSYGEDRYRISPLIQRHVFAKRNIHV